MKKAFALALAVSFTFSVKPVKAQEKEEAATLLGSGNSISTENLGFFVAPAFGFTSMDGSTAALFNVRGGLHLADKLSFGAYYTTSVNQINPESETLPGIYMDYWSVGGFAEYTLLSQKLLHLTFPLYLGFGEVQMDNEEGDAGLGEANFFQIEPAALLEMNLHKYVRLNLGAGYRFVGQMEYRNFDESDISGITAYAGLKLGLFR